VSLRRPPAGSPGDSLDAALKNPCELEIDLFCNGLRVDPSCNLAEDARKLSRIRAGLGSGLEVVLPGPRKDLWMNVPVEEDFALRSPYTLIKRGGGYLVRDGRGGQEYPVRIPDQPEWYTARTSKGTEMCKVGVLQGTYLGIYISNSCTYWYSSPAMNCRFCTTGSNVGVNEMADKDVEDVVEVARAAREKSDAWFVHFNTGYQGGKDLDLVAPYVKAVKERVGALIGVQCMPTLEMEKYDWLVDLGTDHFSFCYEFHNPEYFQRFLPGKHKTIGQETFFRALEYTSRKLGKGAVSGEIIAGVEPIEDTLRAIDYITGAGAFPTVCIFRPVIGADMESWPSPKYEDMLRVFRHVYEACRRNSIPIGLTPNIEVSLIVQPDDTRYLAPPGLPTRLYDLKLAAMSLVAKPLFATRRRPRRIAVDASTPPAPRGARPAAHAA